ncbi:MAG TPA: DUF4167 domain-containing protein [Caulobacteraceae bacterium]|jgi:hypothetical protein|nr:DUF4167 domain-containing protein [Caulobacteraceae bacterium]
MRDFKGIKRNRNRNRNGGGGGGGGKPQHNANRAFDSNGPDGVKVRGAAQHVYEKYQQLARDAHTAGDRVLAENHLQHAEHYFRVLRAMQPQRPLSEIVGRDQFVSGYDIDFEDESGAQAEAAEIEGETAEAEGERQNGGERAGEDRSWRQNDPRGEQRQEWRGEDRGERRFRDDRRRQDRDERPRFERQDRGERPDQREAPAPSSSENTEPQPAETDMASGPMLRADDGEFSHAPAFLQVREPREDGEARRPRRRRPPRDFQAGETPPVEPDSDES